MHLWHRSSGSHPLSTCQSQQCGTLSPPGQSQGTGIYRDVTDSHNPSASPLPLTHDGWVSVSPHWFVFSWASSTGYLEPIFCSLLQIRDDGVVPQVDEPGPEILNSNRAGQKEAGACGGKADSRNGSWVPLLQALGPRPTALRWAHLAGKGPLGTATRHHLHSRQTASPRQGRGLSNSIYPPKAW